jgi:hypothetical protein
VHKFQVNLIEENGYVFHVLIHLINDQVQEFQLNYYFLNNNEHLLEDVQVNYQYDQVNVFVL